MARFEVAGRVFQTESDYEAALRDEAKIKRIRMRVNMDQPSEVIALYRDLQIGWYRFETVVGNDFDDEVYELVLEYRRQEYNKRTKPSTDMKDSKRWKVAAKQAKESIDNKTKKKAVI